MAAFRHIAEFRKKELLSVAAFEALRRPIDYGALWHGSTFAAQSA